MKVLIVEDEIIATSYLKQIVTQAGCTVVGTAGTGEGAIALTKATKPDLILMDIMLKDNISGVDAAVEIKYSHPEVMIAFLTAYTEISMIETAKEANTVGYFVKPYNKQEIIANLHIIASKHMPTPCVDKDITLLAKSYTFNTKLKRLFVDAQEIMLTKREIDLIALLCENRHRVLSFEEILETIWDSTTPHQTLRSLIYRIRQKTHPEFIVSVNKRGYKISTA